MSFLTFYPHDGSFLLLGYFFRRFVCFCSIFLSLLLIPFNIMYYLDHIFLRYVRLFG